MILTILLRIFVRNLLRILLRPLLRNFKSANFQLSSLKKKN